ncbi:DUF3147 family protein [Streptosporangium sp. NPDC087985]|uniref:DUF3147 family protein n=1 Tax=Streptosporangium sp. NPDC087985 TaxID=3366196 RepID=UPI0037F6DA46
MGIKVVVEVLFKAVMGGLFVLMFAALAEMVAPKKLAGVFSAAPSVALGSLLVTVMFTGMADVRIAATGMQIGAAAFILYCLVAVPLLKIWGAWPGALAALGIWLVAVTAGYLLVRS